MQRLLRVRLSRLLLKFVLFSYYLFHVQLRRRTAKSFTLKFLKKIIQPLKVFINRVLRINSFVAFTNISVSMEVFSILFYVTTAVLVLIIVWKTYLFINKTSSHRYTNWFMFDKHHIYNSSSEKTAKAKKTQNTLSLVILIFIVIDLIFLLMVYNNNL